MKEALAQKLLARIMDWKPEDVAFQWRDLHVLSSLKYNDYQQFAPGMRFVESLALWLQQFNTKEERDCAYDFIRRRLVFISELEMQHLVTIAFPDFIRPLLLKQASELSGNSRFKLSQLVNGEHYKTALRKSLFLALSDGAHIDMFRRANPLLTHEQVLPYYKIDEGEAKDLISDLQNDLKVTLSTKDNDLRFTNLFLLDDFSGSGYSYSRKEGEDFNGKIIRIMKSIYFPGLPLNALFDKSDLSIIVVLYSATERAKKRIKEVVSEFQSKFNYSCHFHLITIQELPATLGVDNYGDSKLEPILKKYFDPKVIDAHYKKGRIEKPYYGFDECALPLILYHNAPNNTIPILWFSEDSNHHGLFPRVSRHKEGGSAR